MNRSSEFRYAVNTVVPCKGCPDRHVGCHAKCEDYIFYRKQHDKNTEKYIEDKKKRYGPWVPMKNRKRK